MIRQMSQREKMLAAIVAAALFLFLNFLLVDFFLKSRSRTQASAAAKSRQLKSMQTLTADKALWETREAWVKEKQPVLGNADSAGVQLLDQVKETAKKHTVLLDSPVIRVPNPRPEYTSISVDVETKSSWKALIAFLSEMQKPEQFTVFESANLKIDPNDATQMRGKFRIARWYAPK